MKSRFFHRRRLLVYGFGGPTPQLQALPPRYRVVRLDPTSVNDLFSTRSEDRWRRRAYLRLLVQGCIGMAIVCDDDWASVGWVSHPGSASPPHLARHIIGDDVLWTFYDHTREHFRGRGLQIATLAYRVRMAREAFNDHTSFVFTDVAPSNVASRKAQLRVGFAPAGALFVSTIRLPRLAQLACGRWDRAAAHPPIAITQDQSRVAG